tara:strand:+ start:4634 stop:4816 length:183 start_codon:yes stop_codon:yes gene_type:complete
LELSVLGFEIFKKFFKIISRDSLCGGLSGVMVRIGRGNIDLGSPKTLGGWGRSRARLVPV